MSLICLQYGQCGNQVGKELYRTISEDIGNISGSRSAFVGDLTEKWFHTDKRGVRRARSILIDTEEKVVSNLKFGTRDGWSFDRNLIVSSKVGGSGNNWALGYYENGLELVDRTLDLVDSLAEQCDCGPDGLVSLQGLGGGTGSGLSCFISQALRDFYPKVTQISSSVIPFEEGDICTQPYNTLLSLSKLYDSQDAVVLLSNDYLYKMCVQVLKIKSVKVSDLNSVIAEQLACSFSIGKLSDIVQHLTEHPLYKIISVRSTPHIPPSHVTFEKPISWPAIVGQLKMSLVKSDFNYDFKPFSRNLESKRGRCYPYYKCVSNYLTCRGPSCLEAQIYSEQHPFNDPSIYPLWLPHPPQFLFSGNNKKFMNRSRFATLMTNSNLPYTLLDNIVENAWRLFTHDAYLHHYSKYGLTNKEFLSSFAKFETILKNYSKLD